MAAGLALSRLLGPEVLPGEPGSALVHFHGQFANGKEVPDPEEHQDGSEDGAVHLRTEHGELDVRNHAVDGERVTRDEDEGCGPEKDEDGRGLRAVHLWRVLDFHVSLPPLLCFVENDEDAWPGNPRQASSLDPTGKGAPDRLVESAFAVVVEYRGSWGGLSTGNFQVA